MASLLPDKIFPLRLARKAVLLEGTVLVSPMRRLPVALRFDDEGRAGWFVETAGREARVRLVFEYPKNGLPAVSGRIRTTLPAICQRCLETMSLALDVEVGAALASGEDDARQAYRVGRDVLELEGTAGAISVASWIEDELLLALPDYPRHERCEMERDDTRVTAALLSRGEQRGKASFRKENARQYPFRALGAMMGRRGAKSD